MLKPPEELAEEIAKDCSFNLGQQQKLKRVIASLIRADREAVKKVCEKEMEAWAKRNGFQFGHEGKHRGPGAPDCPTILHHHHDQYCCESPWEAIRARRLED